ncbi:MAG: hypothetical protein ACOCUN_00335 [Jiangellaceae bacterium]
MTEFEVQPEHRHDGTGCPWCPPERGVWVVYRHDPGPQVESVHATEVEALRQINDGTGLLVAFVPFGAGVREVLR